MSTECGQSTETLEIEPEVLDDDEPFVLRWVHPRPVIEPTRIIAAYNLLGRDPECSIRLPSPQVSRRHAAITRSGPLYLIADLGSKNGLMLNGRPIREAALCAGDVLRMGDHVAVCTTSTIHPDWRPSALERLVGQDGAGAADVVACRKDGMAPLPPLRECREIVPELFVVFFEREAGRRPHLEPVFVEQLCCYDWPLELGELDLVASQLALVRSPDEALGATALREAGLSLRSSLRARAVARQTAKPLVPGRPARRQTYPAEEVAALLGTLAQNAGNVSKAASELGITRQKAYRMLATARTSNQRH